VLEKLLRSKIVIWILIVLPGLWPVWPIFIQHDSTVLADPLKYILHHLGFTACVLLAVVLTVPLLVPIHALEAVKHWVEEPLTHGIIMVVIVTLAVVAGLRHGYNQQMAHSEHAKQFGRMSELFDAAQTHLSAQLDAGKLEDGAALLRELGQEALEENGDWVLLHRERPLEVPHSG